MESWNPDCKFIYLIPFELKHGNLEDMERHDSGLEAAAVDMCESFMYYVLVLLDE
jgi:hypothetical protein